MPRRRQRYLNTYTISFDIDHSHKYNPPSERILRLALFKRLAEIETDAQAEGAVVWYRACKRVKTIDILTPSTESEE